MKTSALACLFGGLLGIAIPLGASAQRQPVDDIFLDHPSMDRNATTAPNPDAVPVEAIFRERTVLDASIARNDGGRWFLTGAPQRDGPKDGVRLWASSNGRDWQPLGAVHAARRRVLTPEVAIRGAELYLTFQDEDGCARIAVGSVATPRAAYRESRCLVDNAPHPSLFLDDDGTGYLLWGGGSIARLAPGLDALAEQPKFLKPDPRYFAKAFPEGQAWPVRQRIGETGATMVRDGDRYIVVSSEITGRMRSPTDDVFMAEGTTPYGPFSRRFLAVPHAGRTSILRGKAGELYATYNPRCEDRYAIFCEQVGLVRLERMPDGRLRPDPSTLTESSVAAVTPSILPKIAIRDPSVTLGGDGTYFMVGTTGDNDLSNGEMALWQSSDMKRWRQTHLRFDRDALGARFRNTVALWAPEIKWVETDRTYYLAFSTMERDVGGRTFLYRSVSGSAEGPYKNVTRSHLVTGIDGFLFEDTDGLYLLWGGGNLGKLNARRDGFEKPPVKLVDIDGEPVGYEGNALIRVGNRYVITGAEWNGPLRTHGTYDMMYGSAQSIWGPYEKRRVGVPHAGHGTLFQDREKQWWTTTFGNDVTAPWRKQFGLIPLKISAEGHVSARPK